MWMSGHDTSYVKAACQNNLTYICCFMHGAEDNLASDLFDCLRGPKFLAFDE